MLIFALAACGSESNDSSSEIRAANENQHTATPSPFELTPTRAGSELEVGSIQLENAPDDLTGHLVLEWAEKLFMVPFDETSVEPVLENTYVISVHGDSLLTGTRNTTQSSHDLSVFDMETGERTVMTTLEADYFGRVDKWSPDGHWFTLEINKMIKQEVGSDKWSYSVEFIDFVLFGIDGEQVDLHHRSGAGWLTDSTLLIADPIGSEQSRILRVHPTTGSVTEVDIPEDSRFRFNPTFGMYDDMSLHDMNRILADFDLELVPVEPEYDRFPAIAPDYSYSFKIDLHGEGRAGICADYWLTWEPLEDDFTTRILYTGKAQRVSAPILVDEHIYFLQIASPSCSENDLQVELIRVENFDNPRVETIYTAQPTTALDYGSIYHRHLHYDHYLLWTALQDSHVTIFLTDIYTGSTRVLLSRSYHPEQSLPSLFAVIEH